MDYQDFERLAAGVESLVVATAVVVGGAWTAWTFRTLKSAQLAKLDYEMKALKRPIIDIDISVDPALVRVGRRPSRRQASESERLASDSPEEPEPPRQILRVLVKVKNSGNETAIFDTSEDTLFVREVRTDLLFFSEDFTIIRYRLRMHENNPAKVMVLPGNTQQLQYVIEAPNPGLYRIHFEVPAELGEAASAHTADAIVGGKHAQGRPVWGVTVYHVVNAFSP